MFSRAKIAAIPACKGPLDLGRRVRSLSPNVMERFNNVPHGFRLLNVLPLSLVNSISSAEPVDYWEYWEYWGTVTPFEKGNGV